MTAAVRLIVVVLALLFAGSPAMSAVKLPREARCYFDAIAHENAAAVAGCMAANAWLQDAKRRITGAAAIAEWAGKEVIGGSYTLLAATRTKDGVQILLRFKPRGGGKGFRAIYTISIKGGKIASMVLAS